MVVIKKLSRFNPPVTKGYGGVVVSWSDVVQEIVGDTLKEVTEKLRSLNDKEEERELKKNQLPWITPSGIFSYRDKKHLETHSNVESIDLDYLGDRLPEVKELLINDPCLPTLLLFTSPRGQGLKWFVPVDLERGSHEMWYDAINNYLRETYGLKVDTSCRDVTRACYLCHDPECYVSDEIKNNSEMEYNTDKFDLDFWANASDKRKDIKMSDPIAQRILNAAPVTSFNPDLYKEMEMACQEVERRNIDLTYDYENWRNIGFSLAEELGEQGRGIYHNLSKLCTSKYNESECDKVYDGFLKSNYGGNRMKKGTFFDYMKKAGIDVGAIARKCRGLNTYSHYTQNAKSEEAVLTALNHKRPTFSDRIAKEDWPKLLNPLLAMGNGAEYTDMTFAALFALASGIIPNVMGKYHKRTYSANFYVFVVAPPASNKGDLPLLLNFMKPVEDEIRAEYEKSMEEYRQKVAKQQAKASDNDTTTDTIFIEPPFKTLFAPGDISASMLYETMGNNQERGIILFEPEADVITQACRNKEWGDYSTGLRKAFHHESIQFFRRANKERVEVQRPRLSILISGTPKQVGDLIPSSENGLFSRWFFYWMPQSLEWQDVFAEEDEDYASVIERMGKEYYDKVYRPLSKRSEPLMFKFTSEQRNAFNDYLAEMQEEQVALLGDDIVATVRRLGLITFRLAMTLSVLRLTETNADITTMETLVCDDRDFNIAMEMSDVLISHATSVFSNLLRQPRRTDIEIPDGMTYVEKKMLEQLNTRFTRQEYLDVARKEGISEKSANRYLSNLVSKYNLAIRVRNGVYEMIE